MTSDRVTTVLLIISCAFVPFACNRQHGGDPEVPGIVCPGEHLCGGGSERRTTRGCECDPACAAYRDCCSDVRRRETPAASAICLRDGADTRFGVYAVSSCSSQWNGPLQVKQNCEGSADFGDPVNAVPVTSTVGGITYKNRYCAECNDADADSLEKFDSKLSCEGAKDLTGEESEVNQLSYNQQTEQWGIYRVDARGNTNFTACRLLFSLPRHLKHHVHFCRVNMVSECSRDWPRLQDQRLCREYMAVVYDEEDHVYRNPHCAICNNRTLSELRCRPRKDRTQWRNRLPRSAGGGSSPPGGSPSTTKKNKKFSYTELLDMMKMININDRCPLNHRFDPFLKRCSRLQCAIPGYSLQKGKCVRGS